MPEPTSSPETASEAATTVAPESGLPSQFVLDNIIFDAVLTALMFSAAVIGLLLIGRLAYQLCHRGYSIKYELIESNNAALAVALAGYFGGLVIAFGGVLAGETLGWRADLIDLSIYGLMAIVLLNISVVINDKLLLRYFENKKEIIDDRNLGTGFVQAASCLATGLLLHGVMTGSGDWFTALIFWALGQIVLLIAGALFQLITAYDVHDEIERDNVAVGIAFAGLIIGIGNLLLAATTGDFESWQENLTNFGVIAILGLLLMPLVRIVTDIALLPGAKLSDELTEEQPNIAAGVIEAFSYIAASFVLGWLI